MQNDSFWSREVFIPFLFLKSVISTKLYKVQLKAIFSDVNGEEAVMKGIQERLLKLEYLKKYRAEKYTQLHFQIWCELNPEYFRGWRKKNPDYAKKNSKKWRMEKPDYSKDYSIKWRDEHPNYFKKYRKKNRKKLRKYWREYKRKVRAKAKGS